MQIRQCKLKKKTNTLTATCNATKGMKKGKLFFLKLCFNIKNSECLRWYQCMNGYQGCSSGVCAGCAYCQKKKKKGFQHSFLNCLTTVTFWPPEMQITDGKSVETKKWGRGPTRQRPQPLCWKLSLTISEFEHRVSFGVVSLNRQKNQSRLGIRCYSETQNEISGTFEWYRFKYMNKHCIIYH